MDKNKELQSIKHLMYFNINEGKNAAPSTAVEYSAKGADGKTYGIVREGAKFFIKCTDKTSNIVKEDYDYVGGFRNRFENCFESYNKALKQFELKMISLKEAFGNGRNIVVESWNPDKKNELCVEATEKMRKEIERQRQIMENANNIGKAIVNETKTEGKFPTNLKGENAPFVEGNGGDSEDGMSKEEIKSNQGGKKKEFKGYIPRDDKKRPTNESTEVLGWNDDKDYLDTSKGTEIGDGKPFGSTEDGTVEESCGKCEDGKCQCTNPGTGEADTDHNNQPFNEPIKEEEDLLGGEGDELEEPTDDLGGEGEIEGDVDLDDEGEQEYDLELGDDEEDDDADFDADINARLDSIEATLDKIANEMGVSNFDDDKLYDEEGGEGEENPFESRRRTGKRINEDRTELDYFGKHPAYRKKPMELPGQNGMEADGDLYDAPYGQKIGDGAPFEVDIEEIENAIAESINYHLKKK